MFSTAVTDVQDRSTPPSGGPSGANPVQGLDFVAVLNRLAYSSLAASTAAAGTLIPDTTAVEPADRAPQPCDDRCAEAPREPEAVDGTEQQAADADRRSRPTDERPDGAYDTAARGDDTPPPPAQPAETPAPDAARRPDAIQQSAAAASTQRGGPVGTGAQGTNGSAAAAQTQAPAQTANETPAAPQTGREGAGRPATGAVPQITAQVADGAADGRLPQLGHTLSGRAAVVAQSEASKGGQQSAALKNVPGDAAASAVIPGAAQANGQASKAKGQAKTGNAAAKGAAANGNQSAAQQTAHAAVAEAQAATVNPGIQQRPLAPQPGTGTLAATTGQQASGARAEPFTLAGSGTGTTEFSPRGTATAHAPKPTPPSVPARVVTNQVAVQIQKAFGDGGDRISIQLKPAELGRVDVRLDVGSDGRVAAVITADRADTLDLLQRDARILQNALQDAGLQADGNSLSFELKSQDRAFDGSPHGAPQSGAADEAGDDTVVSSGSATPTSGGIIADDRVDIQV